MVIKLKDVGNGLPSDCKLAKAIMARYDLDENFFHLNLSFCKRYKRKRDTTINRRTPSFSGDYKEEVSVEISEDDH